MIAALDYCFPGPVATFFNIDIVTEFEDVVMAEDELSPGDGSRDGSSAESITSGEDEGTDGDGNKVNLTFHSNDAQHQITSK
jgi:hypothetical protein